MILLASLLIGCAPTELEPAAPGAADPPRNRLTAVVPSRDLAPGDVIRGDDLHVVALERIEGHPQRLADTDLIGRTARQTLLAGEPPRPERLADPTLGIGIGALVPLGWRALTLPVPDGAIEAGDFVDVLVTVQARGRREAETNTVLQAKAALRVAEGRVTLAVTPADAEKLSVPGATYRLSTRNRIDVTRVETHGARPKAAPPPSTSGVVVAVRELSPGVTIREEDLSVVQASGWIGFGDPELVAGRIPRQPIYPFEPIRPERLCDPELGIGLASVIPRGMRGVEVPVSEGSLDALYPGNYVDVLAMLDWDEPQAKTILQAMFVLGLDPEAGTATLLATESQAETLVFATTVDGASVRLTLRNDMDIAYVETD